MIGGRRRRYRDDRRPAGALSLSGGPAAAAVGPSQLSPPGLALPQSRECGPAAPGALGRALKSPGRRRTRRAQRLIIDF
eukprot:655596-Hanusia_phi.AAC.2